MLEWSTTAVSNIYTSPSQTGWSARNQGEDWPVFTAGTHAGALLRERNGWCGNEKSHYLLPPGGNPLDGRGA